MFLLTTRNAKSSYNLAGKHFIFLEKRHSPNYKVYIFEPKLKSPKNSFKAR